MVFTPDDRFLCLALQLSRKINAMLEQAAHGAGGGGEVFGLHAEVLEGGEVEVGEGVVVGGVEGEVATVLEAAAAEEDGHIAIVMRGSVAKVRGEDRHGVIEEAGSFEFAEEVGPAIDGGLLDDGELFEFVAALTVVRKGVVGFIDAIEGADVVRGAVEGDEAGGVGLEGEEDGVEEGAVDIRGVVLVGGGGGFADFGLWFVNPGFVGFEAELEVAD
ncbi:MAG: hypothetical protein ACI8UZ_003544 [Akkermansiaceae bacterium]|jgi:hypothetical protein